MSDKPKKDFDYVCDILDAAGNLMEKLGEYNSSATNEILSKLEAVKNYNEKSLTDLFEKIDESLLEYASIQPKVKQELRGKWKKTKLEFKETLEKDLIPTFEKTRDYLSKLENFVNKIIGDYKKYCGDE